MLLTLVHGSGQANAANWRPVTPQDLRLTAAAIGEPEADAAILFREGELNDNNSEGTSLKLYIRIKIFNERGRRFVDVQLPYRVELGRITDVHARTIRPDGSIVEVEGRDLFDRLLVKTSHGIWRAKVFSMPAVEVGSIIEYRYRQTYPRGFKYFALDLQSELFTRELVYRIQPQLASRLDVRWVPFNTRDDKRFVPVWDGTYNIKVENIPPFRREPLMPPELTIKMWGWLYYSDETETKPDKYWRNYAQRMHERAGDETRPSDAIRRVVGSITSPNNSPQEKIARLYNYTQSEIVNVGFREERAPDDTSPRGPFAKNDSADETVRRRYGTPREINRLFIAMLRAAGFDARVAELTTRDENFFRRSFPDSFQLNGEVTAVVARDGSIQFYDPGTPFCPVNTLSWEKQAVQALVYGSDWRFVETPVAEAGHNGEERKLLVTPRDDGRLDVEAEVKTTGQRAVELRNDFIGLSADELRKRIISSVRLVVPAATVDEGSVTVSNIANASLPLASACKYSVPDLASRTERRLLVKPARLSHVDQSLLPAVRRWNSVYLNYPWSEVEQVAIRVPDGFAIEHLPDSVLEDIGAASYHATFRRDGGQVIYERRLVVNGISFSVEQYATIKAFFDRVQQSDNAGVVFKQLDPHSGRLSR